MDSKGISASFKVRAKALAEERFNRYYQEVKQVTTDWKKEIVRLLREHAYSRYERNTNPFPRFRTKALSRSLHKRVTKHRTSARSWRIRIVRFYTPVFNKGWNYVDKINKWDVRFHPFAGYQQRSFDMLDKRIEEISKR
jgi:hypothetical protein